MSEETQEQPQPEESQKAQEEPRQDNEKGSSGEWEFTSDVVRMTDDEGPTRPTTDKGSGAGRGDGI